LDNEEEVALVIMAVVDLDVSSAVGIVSLDTSLFVSGTSVSGGDGNDGLPRFKRGGGNEYIGRAVVPILCFHFSRNEFACSTAVDFSSSAAGSPGKMVVVVWLGLVGPGVRLVRVMDDGAGTVRCVFQVVGTGDTDFGGGGVRRVDDSGDSSAIHFGFEATTTGLFRTVEGTTGENVVVEEEDD
jgi:hypothetical protein